MTSCHNAGRAVCRMHRHTSYDLIVFSTFPKGRARGLAKHQQDSQEVVSLERGGRSGVTLYRDWRVAGACNRSICGTLGRTDGVFLQETGGDVGQIVEEVPCRLRGCAAKC